MANLERQYEHRPAAPNANLDRIWSAQNRRVFQIWSARLEQQLEARGVNGIKRTSNPKHETTLGTCFLRGGGSPRSFLESLEGTMGNVTKKRIHNHIQHYGILRDRLLA